VPASEVCAKQIDGVERLEQQQARRLPGEEKSTLCPQGKSNKEVSQITKVKKVLRAILPCV
jgi:hypothetical protein